LWLPLDAPRFGRCADGRAGRRLKLRKLAAGCIGWPTAIVESLEETRRSIRTTGDAALAGLRLRSGGEWATGTAAFSAFR